MSESAEVGTTTTTTTTTAVDVEVSQTQQNAQASNDTTSGRQSSKRKKKDDSTKSNRGRRKTSTDDQEVSTDQGHPFNQDGYRYTLAEKDPHSTSEECFRPARSNHVAFAMIDRASQLKPNIDMTEMLGHKGYCMARSTHGVSKGRWYYELEILESEFPDERFNNPHCRLGWAQQHANLQGPVGLDMFSYSWRDVNGSKFHEARGSDYGESYGVGDVLGFYIDLPTSHSPSLLRPKSEYLVVYKHKNYYEQPGADKVDKSKFKPVPGSKLVCYKNGKSQGIMFENLNEGKYFPAVSLYNFSKVKANFGPNFKHPPQDLPDARPLCDAVHVHNAELALADCVGKVVQGNKDMELAEKEKEETERERQR